VRWWVDDPGRWEREVLDMGRWFPDWEYGEDIAERDRLTAQGVAREKLLVRAWEGELRPLPTAHDEAVKILADLAADRVVLVERAGVLRHHHRCAAAHVVPGPLRNRTDYEASFRLRAHQFAPPAHPKVYALQPWLGPELFRTQGHVNGDGSLCPIFAPDEVWNCVEGTLARYLRTGVSILLAKHLYWQWTRDATGIGIWPGQRGPHGLLDGILGSMRQSPDTQCRCGSGRPYAGCHMEPDKEFLRLQGVMLLLDSLRGWGDASG